MLYYGKTERLKGIVVLDSLVCDCSCGCGGFCGGWLVGCFELVANSFSNYFYFLFSLFSFCRSSVFPLTPVVAVIANAFQIRLEITQLCYYTKRPIPKKEEGIGAWMTIVEIISLIGVVVNSAMIITTFKARDSFQNLFGHRGRHFNISSTNTTLSDSDPLSTDLNFLWMMIAVEHGVIIFKLIIREFIEDKPRWVAEAEIAELADESRAEEMEAELAIQEQQDRKKKLRSELNNTKIELAETKKRAASGSNYNAHGVLISRVLGK